MGVGIVPLTDAEIADQVSRIADGEIAAARQIILNEIGRLEAEVTPRRIREAVLSNDAGWLAAQEALIVVERAKL